MEDTHLVNEGVSLFFIVKTFISKVSNILTAGLQQKSGLFLQVVTILEVKRTLLK
jgi:hypothetical protein